MHEIENILGHEGGTPPPPDNEIKKIILIGFAVTKSLVHKDHCSYLMYLVKCHVIKMKGMVFR